MEEHDTEENLSNLVDSIDLQDQYTETKLKRMSEQTLTPKVFVGAFQRSFSGKPSLRKRKKKFVKTIGDANEKT